jgi:hypothetical protein
MASKTADAIKLVLRLPKPLHKRLTQQARRENVSLNTLIVNQLSNPKDLRIGAPYLLKENPLKNLLSNVHAKAIATEIVNQLPVSFYLQKETGELFKVEAAKTRIAALEDEVAHLRGQAESERKVQDMRAVLEREKGEEQK